MSNYCIICNGTEFKLEYGSNVCMECGGHQLDFAELTEDDETAWHINHSKFYDSRKFPVENDLPKDKTSEFSDWSSFEAYNIILKTWTDVLINLGASEKFKDAIFSIWVRLLQKRKVAFCPDEKAPKKGSKRKSISEGDISVLTKRDAVILMNAKFAEKASKQNEEKDPSTVLLEKVKLKVNTQREKRKRDSTLTNFLANQMSQTLDSTKFFENEGEEEISGIADDLEASNYHSRPLMCEDEDDLSFLGLEESEGEETAKEQQIIGIEGRYKKLIVMGDVNRKKDWELFSPYYINLEKLLSLVYLGLLIAEEEILLMDLLRLCREDDLPYQSAGYLIPKEKSFESSDCQIFNRSLPPSIIVRRSAAIFAAFLSIQALPLPTYDLIVSKMLRRLNLPECVEPLVLKIIELFAKKRHSYISVPAVEVTAAAAIILVFKIVYGMDDAHEDILSDWADLFNTFFKQQDSSYRVFSWREWHNYMNHLCCWEKEICLSKLTDQRDSRLCTMDVSRFNNYFWSQGVWKSPVSQRQTTNGKATWDCTLLQYTLGLNRVTIEKVLGEKKPFHAYVDPKDSVLNQYLREANKSDSSSDLSSTMKNAVKLGQSSFLSHTFNWVLFKHEVESEFERAALTVEIVPVVLTSPQRVYETMTDNTSKETPESRKFLVPDPVQSYWKVENSIVLSNLPQSFRWLLKLLAQECETTQVDIYNHFLLLENRYVKSVTKKRETEPKKK